MPKRNTADHQGVRPTRIFRFVFAEMERMQKEVNERRISHWDWQDAVSMISLPSGRRITIGLKAERKLYELARKTIEKHESLNGKIEASKLVAKFKAELAAELTEPTSRSPAEVVEECTVRVIAEHAIPLKFFVPCILPQHSLITRFKIGPITFHRKDRIWGGFRSKVDEERRHWLDQYEQDIGYCNWIAEISLTGFSEKKGRERAYLIVELAVSAMKILVPEKDAPWLGTDAHLMPQLLRHGIHQTENDEILISWRKDYLGFMGDENAARFLSGQRSNFIFLFGGFLEQISERGTFGFIGNKIVSALKWSDTANSHILPAQRIISYANCLEALFVTNERQKTNQICTRAAPFLESVDPTTDWLKEVGAFYDVRCGLVHGDTSPVDVRNTQKIEIAKKITDNCIIGMLYFCVWLLRKYPVDQVRRDDSPFNGKGNFTKAFADELPLYIQDVKNSRSANEESTA